MHRPGTNLCKCPHNHMWNILNDSWHAHTIVCLCRSDRARAEGEKGKKKKQEGEDRIWVKFDVNHI